MSEENVAIVVGQFEAANSGDAGAVQAAWAEDVTLALHGALRAGGGEGASGKRGVAQWFADWFMRFSDYRFEVDETRDLGDRVLLVATHSGRGRSSEAPVSFQATYIYTLDAGRVGRIDIWSDRAEALESAGLRE